MKISVVFQNESRKTYDAVNVFFKNGVFVFSQVDNGKKEIISLLSEKVRILEIEN